MNRMVSLIFFITVVSLVYLGLHLFVYKVIGDHLDLSINIRRIIKICFWFLYLSFFVGMAISRMFKIHCLIHFSYFWLGIISVAFFALLVTWLAAKWLPDLAKLFTIIGLCLTGIIVPVSLVNGLRNPVIKEITVPIKKLPAQWRGFSIVQLSDIHLGSLNSRERIRYIVDAVNNLKPDLLVITGDLIDSDICEEDTYCKYLDRLAATYGILAVTGNHEFYAGLDIFTKLANRSNMRVLRNESVMIGGFLQVVGVDDDEARRFGGKGPDLESALKVCDMSKPVILLYHRPYNFDKAVTRGVDLQLSGHTHGGQIPPMDLLVRLYYKYPVGLFRKADSFIYTSFGAGFWGPPMRFLSRNEIVKITLTD